MRRIFSRSRSSRPIDGSGQRSPPLDRTNVQETSDEVDPQQRGVTQHAQIPSQLIKSGVPPLLTVQEPSPDLKPASSETPQTTFSAESGAAIQPRPPRPSVPTPLSRTVSSNNQSSIARTSSSHSKPTTTPYTKDTDYEGIGGKDQKEDYFGKATLDEPPIKMTRKRIWIRRPGASATQVQVSDDDLVDDLRDMIIRKYSNALGRTYDAPDISLRIIPRELGPGGNERSLGPEESISRTIEGFYPGGQTVEEALLIDVPARRTPRPSPGITRPVHFQEDNQYPADDDQGYFPLMPVAGPHGGNTEARVAFHNSAHPHAMSVIGTGQLPPLPSPRAKGMHRPKIQRQRTASPTIVTGSPGAPVLVPQNRHHRRLESGSGLNKADGHSSNPPPLPTPPASEYVSTNAAGLHSKSSTPPIDRVSSPRVSKMSKRRTKNSSSSNIARPVPSSSLPPELLASSVPPINVLIVEDNIINLKLLEAFCKRQKVRWSTAMNGREAVEKWRLGGFHLVLMDIQLPIMSGLQATKEIRRLERVNGIGVFAKSEGEERAPHISQDQLNGDNLEDSKDPGVEDKLTMGQFFKSPVIIVALTASSLQSDRHEALAAGCNDFLTKPVNFVWLERKVMEWGCMQALIDFSGWRQWKNFDGSGVGDEQRDVKKEAETETAAEKEKREKKEAKRAALLAKMGQA